MLELIATIILLIGFIGMGVILFRKIPALVNLSPQEIKSSGGILIRIKDKVSRNGTIKKFSGELFLQKTLSRIRVLTLRTENKTSAWLAKSHRRSLKKKNKFSDDYWQKLKRGK